MRFSIFALTFGALLCLARPALANICDTPPGNIVQNCGFEDGTYTATIPYLLPPFNSDPGVPNFWNPNTGFIEGYLQDSTLDTVLTDPITGADYLSFGTGEFGPEATLSQMLTDVRGVTYDGYVSGDVSVLVNGEFVSSDGGSFSFVGGGRDDLELYLDGSAADVSDVIVTPAVPEPRAAFLIPVAMLGCLVWLSTRRASARARASRA